MRLTLALTGLLGLLALSLSALLYSTSTRYADELRQRLDAGIGMYVVRELHLMNHGTVNQVALQELARRAMTVNPSAEVYLLDPRGAILSTLVRRERIRRSHVSLVPIARFLRAPEIRPLYGDDPTSDRGRRVFSAAPIDTGDGLAGYLYVILGGQPEQSIAASLRGSYALRTAAAVLGITLFTALLTGAGLFMMLTRRLRGLDGDVRAWANSLPGGARLAVQDSADEISALGNRFRAMSQAIEQQIRDLKSTDDLRRELIANVSHDLRTPLASLRGYIETLLIKGSDNPEELRSHLGVALRQANQLGRLIDALFELAKLESGAIVPDMQTFPIAELLQDIALRFRLRAEKKGLRVHTIFDMRDVMVSADIGLIERVLGNLLENAICHTPAGGQVRIEMSVEDSLVRVRVADTGAGIGAEDLPKIFGRFYSGAGKRDKNRAGLGLPIVKRIMDLHGQQVSVLSQSGVGTTVEITLLRKTDSSIPGLAKSA